MKKNEVKSKKSNPSKARPYGKPELLQHGSLKDLTQFGGSPNADFLSAQAAMGMMGMMN